MDFSEKSPRFWQSRLPIYTYGHAIWPIHRSWYYAYTKRRWVSCYFLDLFNQDVIRVTCIFLMFWWVSQSISNPILCQTGQSLPTASSIPQLFLRGKGWAAQNSWLCFKIPRRQPGKVRLFFCFCIFWKKRKSKDLVAYMDLSKAL